MASCCENIGLIISLAFSVILNFFPLKMIKKKWIMHNMEPLRKKIQSLQLPFSFFHVSFIAIWHGLNPCVCALAHSLPGRRLFLRLLPGSAFVSPENAWQRASTEQLAFAESARAKLPSLPEAAEPAPRNPRFSSPHHTFYTLRRDRQNIYQCSQLNWWAERGEGGEVVGKGRRRRKKNCIRLDSKLVPCHDTCGGGGSTGPPLFPFSFFIIIHAWIIQWQPLA